ncbi:hypothetical protein [Pontivivens ytuae]|uniref:Uncharacterized protein n=1 Tax=Pontivivens ytuae TaxID=2789856 RepID=A0A7S9LNJ7_9RHOB|nr:hypothetical protein [Pontivivens ytuae]QPH52378.1 hypothetical protein I0K15_11125 [Pontivivens ytuae]
MRTRIIGLICGALLAGLVASAWLVLKDGDAGGAIDATRLLGLAGLWLTMSGGALVLAVPVDILARRVIPESPARAAATWAIVGFVGGLFGASGGQFSVATIAIAVEVFALPGGLIGLAVWYIERSLTRSRRSDSV